MKKLISLMLISLMLLGLVPAMAEEEPVLNVFSWATYIDDNTVARFTQETGIRVNYSTFLTNEEMLIKMQSPDNGFDVILASDYALNMLRKDGQLLKLDKELLPNYDNLDPAFLSKYYDENNEYTVPYTAGTPLIVYNPAFVDIEITGYESLWDPALKDSIVVIDDARNIIGITLKTLGYSFNTTDDNQLEEAREKLARLRPNIRAFNYDTPHNDLISGDASVGYMFTPFVLLAMDGNPELQVVYPEEGMGFGIDSLVISADAPHPANAHKLLNFLLDAEVAGNTAGMQYYLSPVEAAFSFIPEYLRDNPAINIPDEILGETEFIMDVGEYESRYQEIWAEFKLLN
ncbi:MAG: spermidine/putrescine ABC transporter substrate-binding protein [Eubacteriales bacterium]|nr:spermidine/putrescine ABC transporter substrate-binding protein [Eubacteriales bacterium]